MSTLLKWCFFALFIRPVLWIVLGLNVRNRQRLPKKGPAIIIANHNSHLDTLLLTALFPMRMWASIAPVAAADYFMRTSTIAWLSRNFIGIIPIARKREGTDDDPLAPISQALQAGRVVIFFPEGSRGEPEVMTVFKSGIARLAERHPEVPIVPIFLHGLGKALPRGEALLVPFVLDAFIGEAQYWNGDMQGFSKLMQQRIEELRATAPKQDYD